MSQIDREIDELVEVISDEIDHLATREPHGLYEPIRYILSQGGKRLRPLLALLTYRAYRPEGEVERVAPVMRAVETFHNFTLLHDDIMDDAPIRRGEPTVYKKWGSSVAILSGDAMLVEAYRCLEALPGELLAPILTRFTAMADAICRGQQYDMEFETMALADVSLPMYLRMIELKTSALFSGSMTMGGLVGGAGEADLKHLSGAARLMGLTFQILDDYLDAFGEVKQFGKQRGGDVIDRKKTWLLLRLYECDPIRTEEALALEGASDRVASVINLYEQWGVHTEALRQADRYTDVALQELKQLSVDISPVAEIFSSLTKRSV